MPSTPSDTARFTLATPADADVVLGMMRELYMLEGLSWHAAAARAGVETLLGDGRLGQVWVVRKGEAPAGYFVLTFGFSLEFHGVWALLDEIYLREEHRRGGLGRRAVEHMEAVCRERGIRTIRLEVEHHNTAARAFYARLGFSGHPRDLLTRWVRVADDDERAEER